MAQVALQNITMKFDSVIALQDLSLEIEDGEFFVILGPAGAGKTTILKVIAGLLKPTRGRVYINGLDVTNVPANLRNIAMTFEDYALYPTFTVYQNLQNPFGALKNRLPKEEVDQKIHQIVTMLQIEHLLHRKVDQLSGGQKQRVSLARSMVRQPRLFLFDEPLSHVDAKIRHSMRAELHRLASVLATTTIYVTHDYVEALSLGDRIMVIDKGVIQQIGTPSEIYHNPKNEFVAKIVGQPTINLFTFQVMKDKERLILQDPTNPQFSFSPKGQAGEILAKNLGETIRVGIRPQDIRYSFTPTNQDYFVSKVDLFELWGRRGMVLIMIGDNPIRILTQSDEVIPAGQEIWLNISEAPLYLFNLAGAKLE
jgi:ABC-type sugar transport system ATPase subunit